MAERVDVCIVGSGFGGSISAWRLAELYRAADVDPKNILVLERGPRFKHTDFKQSMYIGHLERLQPDPVHAGDGRPGRGRERGGRRLEPLPRREHPRAARRDLRAPRSPPRRRPGAADVAEGALAQGARPLLPTRRAGAARRAAALEPGVEVGRPVGGDAECRQLRATASPCAIDLELCQNVKWCHTGCIYGAKNTVNTNYLGAAEDAGVVVRPARRWSAFAAPRRTDTATSSRRRSSTGRGRNPSRQPTGETEEIECKVLILAAGAMGEPADPDALALGPGEPLGRWDATSGSTATTSPRSIRPQKIRDVLGLPGYGQFYKGRPITTMSYDFWHGRRAASTARASRCRRSSCRR